MYILTVFTTGMSDINTETFIKNQNRYFNNSREQLPQAFYYAYSTGAVYKGEEITIRFRYAEKGTEGSFSVARNDKYGK